MDINPINSSAGHTAPAPERAQQGDSVRPAAVRDKAPANSLEQQLAAKERAAERERLVLRPSTVSLQDRLEQVISLDTMKQLLNLRSPEELQKQSEGPGMLFDLRV